MHPNFSEKDSAFALANVNPPEDRLHGSCGAFEEPKQTAAVLGR